MSLRAGCDLGHESVNKWNNSEIRLQIKSTVLFRYMSLQVPVISFELWYLSDESQAPAGFAWPDFSEFTLANPFGNRGGKIFHSLQIHSSKKQLHLCHSGAVEPGNSPSHFYRSQLWEPNRGVTCLPGLRRHLCDEMLSYRKRVKQRAHELSGPLSNNAERVCAQPLSSRWLFFFFPCSPTAPFPLCRWAVPTTAVMLNNFILK